MAEFINNIETVESLIFEALKNLDVKDYQQARINTDKANTISRNIRYIEGLSICLSIVALLDYTEDKNNNYEKSIELLKDGAFMANRANSITALLINELTLGNINFSEENRDTALMHYNNSLKLAKEEDKYCLRIL